MRTDQGGELSCSSSFRNTMLRTFNYVVDPTGTDSPSQNGAVKFYYEHLAVKPLWGQTRSHLLATLWCMGLC